LKIDGCGLYLEPAKKKEKKMAKQSKGPTMTGASQTSDSTKIPHTWQKAIEMWDAGEPVPAFQVESEGASQEQLWSAAFEQLRDPGTALITDFTEREISVVESIVHVAKMGSWPQMLSSYVHATSPSLMIRKPKSSEG
jgi:hypothetical protein